MDTLPSSRAISFIDMQDILLPSRAKLKLNQSMNGFKSIENIPVIIVAA
ncbi:MAG: hypothetical protein H8E32_10830 [Nitrospinae bacterium]|nr:hypothetical protein [Nitrospinota bacterium]